MLAKDRLQELVRYDSDTGLFYSIGRPRIKHDKILGHKRKDGYIVIRCDGVLYLAHRLAWLYVYGEFPKDLIDHIDGNKSNNKICNLRSSEHYLNAQNIKKEHMDNKTGYLFVSHHFPNSQ